MKKKASTILALPLMTLLTLLFFGASPTYADYWLGTCECYYSDPVYSCSFERSLRAETQEELVEQCDSQSNGKGRLKRGTVRLIKEENSNIVCSGSAPAAPPERKGNTAEIHGLLRGRSCVSGPLGKQASKLYCQMYDYPTTYNCNFTMNTNGTCPYMASVQMTMAVENVGHARTWTYCWRFNSEDVKRPRLFTLSADFK